MIKHVDKVLKLLAVMAGDPRYEQLLYDGKEVWSMCTVAEKLTQIGIQQGVQQGMLTSLARLVQKGKLSYTEAIEESGLSNEEFIEQTKLLGFSFDAQK